MLFRNGNANSAIPVPFKNGKNSHCLTTQIQNGEERLS
jgi:hypothetical protein